MISLLQLRRCSPSHSGWKSRTAGLAYVQTPVLGLFKYILGGVCVLKAADLPCARAVFWSGRRIVSSRSQRSRRLALPRGPCRWSPASVGGWARSPARTWDRLPLCSPPRRVLHRRQLGLVRLLWDLAAHLNQQTACAGGRKGDFFSFLALQSFWNRGVFTLYTPAHTGVLGNAFIRLMDRKYNISVILAGLHLRHWVKGKICVNGTACGKKIGCND